MQTFSNVGDGSHVALCISGCDDSQDIVLKGLTQQQADILAVIAEASQDKSSGCVPSLLFAGTEEAAKAQAIAWDTPERYDWEDDEDYADRLRWDGPTVVIVRGG